MDLPWILLFISILIIAIIAWHSSKLSLVNFFKVRLARQAPVEEPLPDLYQEASQADLFEIGEVREIKTSEPVEQTHSQIFCIHLKAPEGKSFAGEQLVIHLNRAGLKFGQFDIFHYQNLFSLASAFEPGTFDLNRIDAMKTSALTFFMDVKHLENPLNAFEAMLETAQHLAENLRAELFDDKWQPLNEVALDRYYDALNPR